MTFDYFWRHSLVKIMNTTASLWSDRLFLELLFLGKKGYWCDFRDPKTFCEKLQWLKLNNCNDKYTEMVDKVEAKKYVSSIVGGKYIIPTLGVWEKFDDIDFSSLPDSFILKCTHDSSGGVICRSQESFDKQKAKKYLEYKRGITYFAKNREYPYKKVPHRILAEEYMVNGTDPELTDYKFYCFNGHADYCQLIANRSTEETIDFFDRDWKHQDFIGLNPKATHSKCHHSRPLNYLEMLDVADSLSTAIGAPFARIDLYNVNGKVYFGEITFFPGSGMGQFTPSEYDLILGNKIKL